MFLYIPVAEVEKRGGSDAAFGTEEEKGPPSDNIGVYIIKYIQKFEFYSPMFLKGDSAAADIPLFSGAIATTTFRDFYAFSSFLAGFFFFLLLQ